MDKVFGGERRFEGGGGGIRKGGGFIWRGGDSCSLREEIFGSFETKLEQWDLQCTPGLRGFGLGGLGRP
jgi:hypothetical protein